MKVSQIIAIAFAACIPIIAAAETPKLVTSYRQITTKSPNGEVNKFATVMTMEERLKKSGIICILLCSKGPSLVDAVVTLKFKNVVVGTSGKILTVVPAGGCLQMSVRVSENALSGHDDLLGEDIIAVVSCSTK